MASFTQNKITFHGKGSELFGIWIVNKFLSIITFNFYYPWARVAQLKYQYQQTEFAGSRFEFLGTGKELFRGYLKALAIFGLLFGLVAFIYYSGFKTSDPNLLRLSVLVLYGGMAAILPLAIYGGMRYRLSRTDWRGIRWGYRGKLGTLYGVCMAGLFLSGITFTIYYSWFLVKLRKEIISNMRFGNAKFNFDGSGSELFWLRFKGGILTLLTFGIYWFWYQAELERWYLENTSIEHEGEIVHLDTTIDAGAIFTTTILNGLQLVFTLGLGYPWTVIRSMNMILSNLQIEDRFNAQALIQSEPEYTDAAGEDLLSMFDINLI